MGTSRERLEALGASLVGEWGVDLVGTRYSQSGTRLPDNWVGYWATEGAARKALETLGAQYCPPIKVINGALQIDPPKGWGLNAVYPNYARIVRRKAKGE